MRLNYGPYERKESDVAIQRTRLQFLWNARARIPAITSDLNEDCYPLYQKFLRLRSDSLKNLPHEKQNHLAGESIGYASHWRDVKASKHTSELLTQLNKWSITHRLEAEWCKQSAVTAMRAWTCDESTRLSLSWCKEPEIARFLLFPEFYTPVRFSAEDLRRLRWAARELGILPFGPDEMTPLWAGVQHSRTILDQYGEDANLRAAEPPTRLPRWSFTDNSREEYLRDVENSAKEAIESSVLCSVDVSYINHLVGQLTRVAAKYCDSVEEYLSRQKEWKKTKVFVDHRAHIKRIVSAVMFQLEGKSYTEIAAAMEAQFGRAPAVSTVKRGVDQILDTIGLDRDRRSEVKRGPKLGSTRSISTKAYNEIRQSLGR